MGWGGLRVEGARILEVGCGTGAVGLACAAMGAEHVWITDVDSAALDLAAANAERNGLRGNVTLCTLDMHDDSPAARPAELSPAFDLLLAADVLYAPVEGAWRDTIAAVRRFLGTAPDARALCSFGRDDKRAAVVQRNVEHFERECARGEAGLRVVARDELSCQFDDGGRQGVLMLLVAPQ